MTTIILDAIARHLDNLPLGQRRRADIFRAWDLAPDAELNFDMDTDEGEDEYAAYLGSSAGEAWQKVRELRLFDPEGATNYATTLWELTFYINAPTKTDILQALARADYKLNGASA